MERAILLTAASGAVIYVPQAYGYILNDDALTHTTAAGTPTELELQLDSENFGLIENDQTIGDGYSTQPLTANLFGQDDVSDTLTIDLTAGSFRSDTISFHGGDGSGVDAATIQGGQYDTISQIFSNSKDGTTLLDPSDSDESVTFHWFGLEPFLVDVGDVGTMIFELPDGVTQAILEDADPTDTDPGLAGKLRLRSPDGAFEATTFSSPSVALVIRGQTLPEVEIVSLDPLFQAEQLTIESQAPLADNQEASTDEDVAVDIQLAASDAQGDSLTFEFVDQPEHGSLTGAAPNLTYTPDPDYSGDDSFSYRVSDGVYSSDVAVVSITVRPVNDAPAAVGGSLSTDEDTAINVTLSATDVDSGPLTFTIVSLPGHGTLTGEGPNLLFTPDPNYAGEDSFRFIARDGSSDSNEAVVSIEIRPVNDAPTAASQAFTAGEDMPKTFSRESLVGGTDIDSPLADLAVVIESQPEHGTVIVDSQSGDLVYTPLANYAGPDSFGYRVFDGQLSSEPATISLDVKPAPQPTIDSITYLNEDAAAERNFSPASNGQRSLIRRIEVVFNGQVDFSQAQITAGIVVESLSSLDDVPVELASSTFDSDSGQMTVVLKILDSAFSDAAGLKDGNYRLTILGAELGVDADGDDLPDGTLVDEFFRFFGDSDGDRDVDALDFNRFRQAYAKTTAGDVLDLLFDYNDNGQTDQTMDYVQFRSRSGKKLAPSYYSL